MQVNDRIHVIDAYNNYIIKVRRISKNFAFASSENNKAYEYKFGIGLNKDLTANIFPKQRFQTTTYTYKPNKN